MELSLLIFVWWLVGAAIFLHICYLIIPVLKVIDLLIAMFAGIFGPLTALYYLQVPRDCRKGWLDIVVWPRR